jgi:hypothetical protein
VYINVRNRQRSTLFQIVSAFALCSTSLAACVSATGEMQSWCWWLWLLCGLQSIAGILVVHARLDARIAARKGTGATTHRGPAILACIALFAAAVPAAVLRDWWIAGALLLIAAGYAYELWRQTRPDSLQLPLKHVGLQAMSLAIVYALLVLAGLW